MGDAALALEAVDFSLLDAPFTGTPVPIDETEGPDQRLEAITALVARGAYQDAARAAEALLRQGVRDVRILGPYLFGHFVADGMKALPVLFRSLSRSLTENWDFFGPPGPKKPIFVDTGLRWLLKMMSKTLEHHTRLKDAQWQSWCTPGNREPIEEALRMGDPIIAAFSVLPKNACADAFRTLMGSLRSHGQGVPYLPPPEEPAAPGAPTGPTLAAAPDEEEDDEDEDDGDDEEEVRPKKRKGRAARAEAQDTGPSVPMSPALAQLVRKLSAFEALVQREDFVKASVIAVDVLATVERFDPRVYLPMLFSGFFNGLSQHADAIEPLLHGTESLGFRALDQLYRVDLDAFLTAQQRPPRGGSSDGYEE